MTTSVNITTTIANVSVANEVATVSLTTGSNVTVSATTTGPQGAIGPAGANGTGVPANGTQNYLLAADANGNGTWVSTITNIEQKAARETEYASNAVGGANVTVDYANGNVINVAANGGTVTFVKGTWPANVSCSKTVHVQFAAAANLAWSGWSHVNSANEPSGANATTYGIYELAQFNNAAYIFVVEEG